MAKSVLISAPGDKKIYLNTDRYIFHEEIKDSPDGMLTNIFTDGRPGNWAHKTKLTPEEIAKLISR